MGLFGWPKSGRDDARPALSRVGATRLVGGAWSGTYESQVRAGYERNPVARRAVRLICDGMAEAPLEECDPVAAALVGARSGGQALLATISAHMVLHGNAFVQLLRDPDGGVVELYALRPDRVTVEADAGGWPASYAYRVGERVTRLHADGPKPEIVHIRGFAPLDDHYWLGALGAAAEAVAVHNAASAWNRGLLDNAARPSGALVYEPGDGSALSSEQFERLRGRRGTEWAAGTQMAGDRFVLLEPDALVAIDLPLASLGKNVRLLASGVGDLTGPAAAEAAIDGASLRPPAPVGLQWVASDDGGGVVRWTRRSRAGWRWLDGADAPLAEEAERYRVEVGPRSLVVEAPATTVTAAERAARPLAVTVRQLGTYAESRAVTLIVPAA